jgi:hypothetical protein
MNNIDYTTENNVNINVFKNYINKTIHEIDKQKSMGIYGIFNKQSTRVESQNIEFEIRFGNYGRISSNIYPSTFSEINTYIKIFNKSKKINYTYIKDIIFKKGYCKKRTVYQDTTGSVKQIFKLLELNKNIETYIEDEVHKNIKSNINTNKIIEDVYIKKDKIIKGKNQNKFNNFKLDLVNEISYHKNSTEYNNMEKLPKSNIKSTRHKFRCSYSNDMWIYDLTIMLYQEDATKKYGIFYEIEMEFNNIYTDSLKKSINVDIIYQSLIHNVNKLTNIINCTESKNIIDYELNSGTIHNSVVTLERSNFHYLKNAKYAVCDKADGERKFIYIDNNNNVFHINPTEDLIEKIYIGKTKSTKISCSLLDCELITEFIKSKKSVNTKNPQFFGFDLLFYNNVDCRSFNLVKRLNLLKTAMSELENNIMDISKYEAISQSGGKPNIKFSYMMKKFYITNVYKNAEHIWRNRIKLFTYDLDGLIFTPINSSYIGYLPNLKWKDKHSIDIRVFYNKYDDFTEFYSHGRPVVKNDVIINEYKVNNEIYYKNKMFISGNDKPIQKYKELHLISNSNILGVSGKLMDDSGNQLNNMEDIIEVEFLHSVKKWIYLRKREDKDKPNAYLSILSVLNAVVDNITPMNIKEIKYISSVYDIIGSTNNKCINDIGFNFVDGNTNINKFYTYSHKTIFNLSYNSKKEINTIKHTNNDKNMLILGCNKMILCGLYSFLLDKKETINITIIENNCLEVFANNLSEGYIGLLDCCKSIQQKLVMSGLNHRIQILWGSANIFDKNNSYIGFNKKIIKKKSIDIIKTKYDILYINNLEYTFFNKENCRVDDNLFLNYINGIKQIMKATGIIIGTFLSGHEIEMELIKNKCIMLKNDTFHPLYKLYKHDNKLTKDNTANLIQIKRMETGFFNENQIMINDDYILNKFQMFKKIECNTFKSLYTNYLKITSNIIDEYDIIISNITKYIIFHNL